MKSINLIFSLMVTILVLFCSLFIPFNQSNQSLEAATSWTKSAVDIESEKYIVDSYVIKESSSSYKMWYTHLKADMSISDVYTALSSTDLNTRLYALLDALQTYNFDGFLTGLSGLTPADFSDIKGIFDGMSTVIGYATSTDGKSWTIQYSEVLSGSTSGIWTSIGLPCVIKNSDTDYQMWYTSLQTSLTEAELQTVFSNMADPAKRSAALSTLLDSTKTVISYATSSDGITWTKLPDPALDVTGADWLLFDSVTAPSIAKIDDDNYEMWYTRLKTDFDTSDLDALLTEIQNDAVDLTDLLNILDSTSSVIGYAVSSDGGETFGGGNSEVFSGGAAIWQSVADPYVIKTSSKYEMWYMNGTTDLVQSTLRTALDAVKGLQIPNLWNSLKTKTLSEFINDDVKSIDFTGLETALIGTAGVIGYADSSNGASWTVKSANELTGEATTPWSSVGAPSIVKSSSTTEIWFSKGIPALTWQNVADRILGDNSGLGYASVSSGGGFFGGGGAAPSPISKVGEVCWPLTPSGYTIVDITLWSEDEMCTVFIPKTTKTLTMDYEELKCISVDIMEPSPAAPEDKIVIVAYNIEPEGAMFDPAITISVKYDLSSIPEDVEESSLELAYLDSTTGKWANLDDVEVDTENHVISGKTDHFTPFGVLSDEGVTPETPTEPPPVTPPTLEPAVFVISALTISPTIVEIGEQVNIDVTVTNTGEQAGTYTVKLMINNVVSDTRDVVLRVGESRTITFTAFENTAGTYNVVIDRLSGSFTVKAAEKPPEIPTTPITPEPKPVNWWIIIGSIILGVVVVVVAGWFIITRREKF